MAEIQLASKLVRVKATVDIPDELYRRVKAKSALDGRTIRDVTVELFQRWLSEAAPPVTPVTPEQWLTEWIRLGEEAMTVRADGPTATEVLMADRERLERR